MAGKSKWDAARHSNKLTTSGLTPKPVRESQSEITQMVLPNDGNPMGNILGGMVMHQMDIVAAIAAGRHSGSYVVTASMDHLDFRAPIRVGEIIILKASRIWRWTFLRSAIPSHQSRIKDPEYQINCLARLISSTSFLRMPIFF